MNKNHKEVEDDILSKVSGKINFKEKRRKHFFELFEYRGLHWIWNAHTYNNI